MHNVIRRLVFSLISAMGKGDATVLCGSSWCVIYLEMLPLFLGTYRLPRLLFFEPKKKCMLRLTKYLFENKKNQVEPFFFQF